jgi:signal transduction histidine kinase
VEIASYYVIAEALTNIAKYAHADTAQVRVKRLNGSVSVEVTDDGVGGAVDKVGGGLRGLNDRVAAHGGRLSVENGPERGTILTAELPCGS